MATCDKERRQAISTGWVLVKWAGLLAFTLPLLKFVQFKIPRKPRYMKVDKKILPGEIYLDNDFVLFLSPENKAWALTRKCTHLGCRLNYSEDEKLLICPCHQSKFTPQGKRVAGPAKDDLQQYKVEEIGNGEGFVVTV